MMAGAQVAFTRQANGLQDFGRSRRPTIGRLDATYQLGLLPAQQDKISGGTGIDGIAAFKYFIKHYDHGRAFILAGHSQGSAVLKYLLSDYMKAHPAVYRRMIAAYVVANRHPHYPAKNRPEVRQGPQRHRGDRSRRTRGCYGRRPTRHTAQGIGHQPITWTRGQTVRAPRRTGLPSS